MQNRYYLSVVGRSIQSYTYISSQNRLVRLTNHDHIAEADWTELCGSLQKESSDYQGNIDNLFQAELYLISPITEPARFLKKEYFLTSQQRDIQRLDALIIRLALVIERVRLVMGAIEIIERDGISPAAHTFYLSRYERGCGGLARGRRPRKHNYLFVYVIKNNLRRLFHTAAVTLRAGINELLRRKRHIVDIGIGPL